MPVWAVWEAGRLWFSSSLGSRTMRNLAANPVVAVATEDGLGVGLTCSRTWPSPLR